VGKVQITVFMMVMSETVYMV